MELFYPLKAKEIKIDVERCRGEGFCVTMCSMGCYDIEGEKVAVKDIGACRVCYACEVRCPEGAIEVIEGGFNEI
ncbi:MAG: tungsten formylmethanofuran dehydrogenase [Candidatus Syntropharchaeia archaeon]